MDYTKLVYAIPLSYPPHAIAIIWQNVPPGRAVMRQGDDLVVTGRNGSVRVH